MLLSLAISLVISMNENQRRQQMYEKTEFNFSKICMLDNIFKCSKCKHNNTIYPKAGIIYQHCMFCGNPNYIKKK
jgi:hypothetical protein